MDKIKVSKQELLEKIIVNRNNHREKFLRAQEGYRKEVIEELDIMLTDARNGKNIRRSVELPEPQDHTDDYNRVVQMLKMSQEAIIEIDARQFEMYVRDNWGWKEIFHETNLRYIK
jgi:hypothetical protein